MIKKIDMKKSIKRGLRKWRYWLLLPILLVGALSIIASGGGGIKLSFIIMDNPRNQQPLSGVTVALYDIDNVTIASTKVSDENGVADFGYVGRERVTFTVAHEYDQTTSTGITNYRDIQSHIEVLAVEGMIFYVEDPHDGGNEVGRINISLEPDTIPLDTAYH
ncbi:MAG: hypothetical protein ABFS45_17625 [Pseudomonadota bacterium]